MIVVGVKPSEWVRTAELAMAYSELFCILGWHPNYCADYDPGPLRQLERLLGNPKVLALGEIGLDYHWDRAPRDKQFAALNDQLDLAERVGKPVVFHAREAYGDLLSVLESRSRRSYVFHCFGGDLEEARRAVELDAYFGVDGPLTYKKAEDLRGVVGSLPRDRVVLETDCPYLTPVPFRGRPNEPAYVPYIAEALGLIWGVPVEEVAEVTTANAVRFFGSQQLR